MKRFLITLAALTLFACHSPILDHSNAEDVVRAPQLAADPACPLVFPEHGLCASLTWDRPPNDSDMGSALIRFWKKGVGTEAGPYVDPLHNVFVKLWMPAMGHGSSPTTTARKLDTSATAIPGVFETSKIFFVMPGKWEVWVQLKRGATVHSQAKLDVEI